MLHCVLHLPRRGATPAAGHCGTAHDEVWRLPAQVSMQYNDRLVAAEDVARTLGVHADADTASGWTPYLSPDRHPVQNAGPIGSSCFSPWPVPCDVQS